MRSTSRFVLVGTIAVLCGCGAPEEPAPEAAVPQTQLGSSTMPHGDHSARYGGTVWMHGDLHFEVVLGADGRHQVYFSDASRVELPASVASEVTITIARTDGEPEPLSLAIDEYGESWLVSGAPVDDPEARALVRFVYEGAPYEIDVPFVVEVDPNAPDPHSMHGRAAGGEWERYS